MHRMNYPFGYDCDLHEQSNTSWIIGWWHVCLLEINKHYAMLISYAPAVPSGTIPPWLYSFTPGPTSETEDPWHAQTGARDCCLVQVEH